MGDDFLLGYIWLHSWMYGEAGDRTESAAPCTMEIKTGLPYFRTVIQSCYHNFVVQAKELAKWCLIARALQLMFPSYCICLYK